MGNAPELEELVPAVAGHVDQQVRAGIALEPLARGDTGGVAPR